MSRRPKTGALAVSIAVAPAVCFALCLAVAAVALLWALGIIDPVVARGVNSAGNATATGIQEFHHAEYADLVLALLAALVAGIVACWRPVAIRRRCWPSQWALVDACRRATGEEARTCRGRAAPSRARRAAFGETVACLLVLCAALLAVGCVVGLGLLNRVRGGWVDALSITLPGSDDADLVRRLLFDVPCGALVALLSGSPELGGAFALLMYLGNLPGWGCYFGMAHGLPAPGHGDCADDGDRYGMFDWALGRPTFLNASAEPTPSHDAARQWDHTRLFVRDWAAMSLRGLVWLAPPGLLLHAAGFGPLLVLSGVSMALVYEAGHDVSFPAARSGSPLAALLANFERGTPMAELLWGLAVSTLLLLALLGGRSAELWRERHCCRREGAARVAAAELDDDPAARSADASAAARAMWPCCARRVLDPCCGALLPIPLAGEEGRRKQASQDSLLPPIGEERPSSLSLLTGFPLRAGGRDMFDVHSLGSSSGGGVEVGSGGGIASLSDGADPALEGDYLNRRRIVSYPRTEDGMPWRTHSDSTSSTVQSDDDRDVERGFSTGLGSTVDSDGALQCGVRCRSCLRAYDWPGSIELAYDDARRADSVNSADAGADAAWVGFLARAFCGRLQHDREALWRAPTTVGLWELMGCGCAPPAAADGGAPEYADDAEISAEAGGNDVDVEIWLAPHVSRAALAARCARPRALLLRAEPRACPRPPRLLTFARPRSPCTRARAPTQCRVAPCECGFFEPWLERTSCSRPQYNYRYGYTPQPRCAPCACRRVELRGSPELDISVVVDIIEDLDLGASDVAGDDRAEPMKSLRVSAAGRIATACCVANVAATAAMVVLWGAMLVAVVWAVVEEYR